MMMIRSQICHQIKEGRELCAFFNQNDTPDRFKQKKSLQHIKRISITPLNDKSGHLSKHLSRFHPKVKHDKQNSNHNLNTSERTHSNHKLKTSFCLYHGKQYNLQLKIMHGSYNVRGLPKEH